MADSTPDDIDRPILYFARDPYGAVVDFFDEPDWLSPVVGKCVHSPTSAAMSGISYIRGCAFGCLQLQAL